MTTSQRRAGASLVARGAIPALLSVDAWTVPNSSEGAASKPWWQMQDDPGSERPKLSTLLGRFAGHVVIGTGGFVILAVPAILLSLAAHHLRETAVSEIVIWVLLAVHYFLLAVDALVFVAYILISLYSAGVALVRYVRDLQSHALQ
jgi:hypothetical protein